jgi:antitoxin component YwqK of YwqJK toxin-antitoxin module
MNQSDKEQINQLDGLNTVWYENGQKKNEGTYKNGKEDGLWTHWYENGKKRGEGTFKDGKIISQKEWNEDGSVKE